jgi:hypothetical protein
MIHDAAVPADLGPSSFAAVERLGVYYSSARWVADDFVRLGQHLGSQGAAALAAVSDEALLAAWSATVKAFRDAASDERQALDRPLARFCRLSAPGLEAGLEAVLGGVRKAAAVKLLAAASRVPRDPSPVLAILAANLPALAVQPLLPALLLRRPVVIKSPSAEPLFAPAFVSALVRREPRLGPALAAVTWTGGDQALEAPLLAAAGRVLAYGEATTLADLEQRAPDKLFGYGPKTSLAVVAADAQISEVAAGLARDVALFDQRGCLSVQAIYTAAAGDALARSLARELARLSLEWPPGPPDPVIAAAVQQIRMDASLRGLSRSELPLEVGTVVVEPQPDFHPSPGLRTVRIHPLESLDGLPEILVPWSEQLQGVALAGAEARRLQPRLEALGISRFAEPGELQSPDATWHNGGVHPITALTGLSL